MHSVFYKVQVEKTFQEALFASYDVISRLTLLSISSFNRMSYREAVTMSAFKESGSLEYGSDVLIGLQLKGAGEDNFDVDIAKQADPRKVEVVILKNRNGATGKHIDFDFYAKFNYFEEKW